MRYTVQNKVAIITGASEGIGLAIARLLHRKGAKVVLAARRENRLNEAARELPGSLAVPADVTKESDVRRLVDQAIEKFGRVDILINNAGLLIYKPMNDTSMDEIRSVMELNFFAQVVCARTVMPHFLTQGSGTIINLASVSGRVGFPNLGYYAASKFALTGFSETLRQEVASKGIHVGLVNPGTVYTPLTKDILEKAKARGKKVRYIQAEDVAESVLEAIEKRKDEVFVPFATHVLYGLHFFFPKFVEWLAWKFRSSDPNDFR